MKQFMPSKGLVENICEGSPILSCKHHRISTTLEAEAQEVALRNAVKRAAEDVSHYFFGRGVDECVEEFTDAFPNIILPTWEALKNAYAHRGEIPQRQDIVLGTFLGNKGALVGFYDGGPFFGREEVKRCLEERRDWRSVTEPGQRKKGWAVFGAGITTSMYECDIIEVDTAERVLYLGHLKR